MEVLGRQAALARCRNYVHRTRLLGVRNLTTETETSCTGISTATPPPNRNDHVIAANKQKTNGAAAATATTTTPALLTLQPATLHAYTSSSLAPSPVQLSYANTTFISNPPQHLFTSFYFRQFPASTHPEVCFLGRSNVGKSSLLNALFNRTNARTAHVSSKPGRTRTMNAFGVGRTWDENVLRAAGGKSADKWKALGRGGVVVVDMPGYGKGSRDEWGAEIMKYLEKRKQLRKTFLLIDASHGLKTTDLQLLSHFKQNGIQHQIILSKVDKILHPNARTPSPQKLHNNILALRRTIDDIRDRIDQPAADILCVSAEKDMHMPGVPKGGKLGVDAVRWAALRACALDCDETGKPREYETFTAVDPDE